MRIGIDIRSLSSENYSGVTEYINNLLPFLFRLGKEDQFVLLYNSYRKPLPPKVREWQKYPNVRVADYSWPSKILNASLWIIGRPRLDKMLNGIDVMFFPNIIFSSLSKKVPYVITFHDLSFEFFPNLFNPYRRLWHFLINARQKALGASKIITVSNSTARDIADTYKISLNKIHSVPLGLSDIFWKKNLSVNAQSSEIDLFSYQHKRVAEEWNFRKKYRITNNPFILYLGTIEPRKNLVSLIKAYEEFRKKSKLPYDLVIAGSKGWSYKEIFQYAENSSLRNSIYFPGGIENNDKPTIYRMASLFVFPSFFEGFGLPPLEALASGTPVICSGSSSLLEIFGDHTVMVNPHDPSEIAWAIERVLTDKNLRESLVSNGKEFALSFSWDKVAAKTLLILRKAANKEEAIS